VRSSSQHRASSRTTQKKGAVTQVVDSGASREIWSARYEQLRAGWFVHELTWGQGLFVRQGMAAWMKAWPAAEPSESATRPDSPESDSSQLVAMGGELQRQLARELANLILHHRQQVLA
jgi:hypothetical protein